MKRAISVFVLWAVIASNVVAGTIHAVEVRPLAREALIGPRDFVSAELGGGDQAVLSIRVKNAAAKRLRRYTATHIGKPLPLVVDGKVVGAPVVRAAIEGGVFEAGPMDRELAESVVRYINAH